MDEMVDLDDICHFRAEIDAYPSYNEDNFYFTIDLLFADLATSSSEPPSLKVFHIHEINNSFIHVQGT